MNIYLPKHVCVFVEVIFLLKNQSIPANIDEVNISFNEVILGLFGISR